jgi:hypothetical protein
MLGLEHKSSKTETKQKQFQNHPTFLSDNFFFSPIIPKKDLAEKMGILNRKKY